MDSPVTNRNLMEGNVHPMLRQIQSYGICSEAESHTVFQVYLDLCEVQNWWNVRIHLCPQLYLLFLSGHPNCTQPREIVLPIDCLKEVSPQDLKRYTTYLKIDKCPTESLTLAVYETDSTIIYMKVQAGLLRPNSPSTEANPTKLSWNRSQFLSLEEKNLYLQEYQQKFTG